MRNRSFIVRIADAVSSFSANAGSGFASVTSLATVIMIVMGTLDVIGTKLLNTPIPSAYESTETLMVALVFGGLSYAQLQKRHIRVEFVTQRLSGVLSDIVTLIGTFTGLVFFSFFTWTAWGYFWKSWLIRESEPSIIQFPIYPSKLVMVLGAGLLTLQLFIDCVKTASHVLGDRRSRKT